MSQCKKPRPPNVLEKALEIMQPAIFRVMKPSKLDGYIFFYFFYYFHLYCLRFGSIYPEDHEIFCGIEALYNVGIRIYDQKGWIYRDTYLDNVMEVMFRQDDSGERYSIILNSESLGNRYICDGCERVYTRYKNIIRHKREFCTGKHISEQEEPEHQYDQGIWRPKLNIIQVKIK